ncbi:hypothetical protein [Corallococcus llansteffanensis]|uniref:Uncharacterized protein n=1 Tax=Corallococcus llansteffanensis TaxID=2316731 RepID=A0A3A8P5N1_9BACT|nr:hypothetical protein [Corallococcus llansteffanensis]RKH50730.1 hypothetical protein D7V93_30190 [Corallococcus llansteffanensis]
MSAPPSSIFRAGALERFVQGRTRLVLPAFVEPRARALLWLGLVLVLACGALAWSAEVPRFEPGVAVVVQGTGGDTEPTAAGPAQAVLLVFLPPQALSDLRSGQPVFLEPASRAGQFTSDVLTVQPQVLSPQAARERYGAAAVPPQAGAGPSAVLVARLRPSSPGQRASDYLGSTFPVRVRVGSQRLLHLLPFGSAARSRTP